jgi:ABC-type glycerol-3-phosphate transport system permease component
LENAWNSICCLLRSQAALEVIRKEYIGAVRIEVPNTKMVAVVVILSFLGAWNQYLWPLLILNEFESKTLATGMQFFTGNAESAQMWGPMMATAAIATLPPLVIYAFAQKQIIETFVTSGIKG